MQTMLPFVVQKSRAHIKGLLRDNFWYNNVFSFLHREFIPLNSPHLENDWKVCAKVLNPFNGIAQNDFIAQDCNHWREKITDLNFVSIFVSWKNSYLSKISFHLNENEFYTIFFIQTKCDWIVCGKMLSSCQQKYSSEFIGYKRATSKGFRNICLLI